MYVVKRNGTTQPVHFDEITNRIQECCDHEPKLCNVDPVLISQKVVNGVYPGVKTSELDTLAAETAAYMSTVHPEYGELAARIAISNLQKYAPTTFSECIFRCYHNISEKAQILKTNDLSNGPLHAPLISDEVYKIVMENKEELNSAIVPARDFYFDYFGFKTLERSYLMRTNGLIMETPQYMYMRVALGMYGSSIAEAIETYELMSMKLFTAATPTLFYAGTPRPQMSSCFLLSMTDDSIEGIYETLKRCAMISKNAGGIGVSISNIRATRSYIKGTNGYSNGLVPMLRVYNDTARYVDQGGGKRKGAFAVWLEPWHADIFEFLELKKNIGKEEQRARDLFYGLWVPDLFMKRVEANEEWSLFCPNEAPGLYEKWGNEFDQLYIKYENTSGLARRKIKAQELWFAIVQSQSETGTPYMMYKDACNRKSNQQNLGTIRCSNLCTEIVEYSSPDEIAVCNLSSIALPKFYINGTFNHEFLFDVTALITRNLNKVIDRNYYPLPQAQKSNLRHRPIGIGVQGLADLFMKMKISWESDEAEKLNKEIFETIYFAALSASMELAKIDGPYETFAGSPLSRGIFQFDMWGVAPSGRWDWNKLRKNVMQFGARNSLVTSPPPTASTSQILGNNESFEPYTSNIYTRSVLSGEFTIVNSHLVADLMELNLWTPEMKNKILEQKGSVQNIEEIPKKLRDIYKTVWEIPQKRLVNMAADRGAYIDQSQSFNVFLTQVTSSQLTSFHFYGWKKGLKTGSYYIRTKAAADAIPFTLEPKKLSKEEKDQDSDDKLYCTKQDGCVTCGS